MRPSISVPLEPGSEQGVPWGRDLYTFVTSAAGHMMRTLQRPRKNRPSKRQVNHRRFLHNMIQRKFADIEAANHRLAAALHEEERTSSSPQPQDEAAAGRVSQSSTERRSDHTDTDDAPRSRTDVSAESGRPEVAGNPRHPWRPRGEEAWPDSCGATGKNQVKGRERKRSGGESDQRQRAEGSENPLGSIHHHLLLLHSDDSAQLESTFEPSGQTSDTPPPLSPDLSPLSLDSCDFSIQMFTDVPACAQAQSGGGGTDAAESPWADILDLFGFGTKDPGACVDVGAYFQSIYGDDDSAFADLSGGFDADGEEYPCGDGLGCHGDQVGAMSQCSDTSQHQVPPSTSCYFNHQRLQELSPCKLSNWDNKQPFTPFEGVAQSFSAPTLSPELGPPVRTPPHEQDLLFPDILLERMTPP